MGLDSADSATESEPRDWLDNDNTDESRGYGQAFEGYLR
jgi:hypothetical protein